MAGPVIRPYLWMTLNQRYISGSFCNNKKETANWQQWTTDPLHAPYLYATNCSTKGTYTYPNTILDPDQQYPCNECLFRLNATYYEWFYSTAQKYVLNDISAQEFPFHCFKTVNIDPFQQLIR
jgi:hypothetical protein